VRREEAFSPPKAGRRFKDLPQVTVPIAGEVFSLLSLPRLRLGLLFDPEYLTSRIFDPKKD
jgi:hypothetical protein